MMEKSILIEKFLEGNLTKEERKELEGWVLSQKKNRILFEQRIREHHRTSQMDFDAEKAFRTFSDTIEKRKSKTNIPGTTFKLGTFPRPITVLKYAAVIAVLLALGFLMKDTITDGFFDSQNNILKNNPTVTSAPEKEGILLKLQDGSTHEIDSESDGTVQDAQGNVIANKDRDRLTFGSDGEAENAPIRYNEIFIPNGQKFKIQLSDGTWVWLNSGSKLRFPQHFAASSKSRKVFLEGEAYFDVAKNIEKPFIVNAQNINIEVLGTRFNLSAYSSDDAIATTLVEGAVNVYQTETPENSLQLDPSYQARFSKATQNLGKQKVDTHLYTAWMHDRLIINDLTFPEIMKKLERSHNVMFINKVPHLNNEIYQGEFNNEDIEAILNTIALSTPFTYKVEQNKITIMK
ncbi:MAG: FecR domain-containing protein [Pricia sp.]